MGYENKIGGGNEIVKPEVVTPVVDSMEEQFNGDPEITAEVAEMEKQQAIFKSATAEDVIRVISNPEKKGRFIGNLEKLQSKFKKLEKYWPAMITAGIAITSLIAAFALDTDIESSKMQISDGLAATSVGLGFLTAFKYLDITKTEKGGASNTPQHA